MVKFAYAGVEYKCVLHMFTKMGIPRARGVKRHMDDIIVALLCRTPAEVTVASTFVTEQAYFLTPSTLPQHGTPGQTRVPRSQCDSQW